MTSYGSSGAGSVSVGAFGPNGEMAVFLQTVTATGSAFVIQPNIPASGYSTVELSFLLRTVGETEVEVGVTARSSGGVSVSDRSTTIRTDSLGWTPVRLSLDIPRVADSITLRFGIPPNFSYPGQAWILSPSLEPLRSVILANPAPTISSRSTVFARRPVVAKSLYLVFSREACDFSPRALPPNRLRLLRSPYLGSDLLSWDSSVSRGEGERPLTNSAVPSRALADVTREVAGVSWMRAQTPPSSGSSSPAYEYEIGLFNLGIRRREYEPTARYVSEPLVINGEPRKISLTADDEIINSYGEIAYRITMSESDPPEKGIPILNSLRYLSDPSLAAASPITSLPYLPASGWIAGGPSGSFVPDTWYVDAYLGSNYPPMADVMVCSINTSRTSVPGDYVSFRLPNTLDVTGTSSISFDYDFTTNISRMVPAPVSFSFELSSDGANWFGQTFSATVHQTAPGQWNLAPSGGAPQFDSATLNLTALSGDWKRTVNYIRFRLDGPCPAGVFAFRRLTPAGWFNGDRTISIYPADDIPPGVYPSSYDFVAPVLHKSETLNGTDRNGNAALSSYPYSNRTTILDLVSLLSSNTGGRTVAFDPNAVSPLYVSTPSSGSNPAEVSAAAGYRPIRVTLYFPNTKTTVPPDILGKPRTGDAEFVVGEILQVAQQTLTSQSQTQTVSVTGDVAASLLSQTTLLLGTTRTYQTYQTQYPNIVAGPKGISFSCRWVSSTGTPSGSVAVAANNLSVNAETGVVSLYSAAPSGYDQLVANYWRIVGESSPRESFSYADETAAYSLLGEGSPPQTYPVTRNMTDYVGGTIPTLTPADLDPLSPTYHPVYEYYVHPNGYLVFAESLHPYSATPAQITVEYDTLGISPRLVIDLTRPDELPPNDGSESSLSPSVSGWALRVDARRS